MTQHSGSCLCGAVRFDLEGAFESFFLCHCRHCQKGTGSAHAANLFSRSASLTWHSGQDAVTVFSLPGTQYSKSFCKHCGSALPGVQSAGVVVPAGCLDTAVSMAPTAHIFTASKAGWDGEFPDTPRFAGLPE